ncbi:MAG: hypothetical protein ACPW60_11225 [Methylohalobius sp. ZOD2]
MIPFRSTHLSFRNFGAIVPPALGSIYLIHQADTLPDNDYWEYLISVLTPNGLSHSASDWFSHGTEHWVLLPKLIYAANLLLTHGDNQGLGAFAFVFALAETLLLLRLAAPVFTRPALRWTGPFICAALLFTPRAAHNWMMPMSGVAWFGANLATIVAIYFLCRKKFYPAVAAGLAGLTVYSTALAAWPALAAGAFLLGYKWQRIGGLILLTGLIYAGFLAGFHTPAGHPPIARDGFLIGRYGLIFIGGLAAGRTETALVIGLASLIASLLLYGHFSRRRALWPLCAPWIMLQVYALGNAGMAALARAGFGLEQALSSRYASLPALFWLGLFMLALVALQHRHRHPEASRSEIASAPVIACALGLIACTVYASLPLISHFIARNKNKPLAMISLYTGAYDLSLLADTVTPLLAQPQLAGLMERELPLLKRFRHVPFDDTFSACPPMGAVLPPAPINDAKVRGFIDQVDGVAPLVYRIRGWANADEEAIRCIALINRDRTVRGIAVPGLEPRPDVVRHLGVTDPNSGWIGYARCQPGDLSLTAQVSTATGWRRLNGSITLASTGGAP